MTRSRLAMLLALSSITVTLVAVWWWALLDMVPEIGVAVVVTATTLVVAAFFLAMEGT